MASMLFYFISAILILSANGKILTKRQVIFNDYDSGSGSVNDCKTPTGGAGTCTRLIECQPVYDKVKNRDFSSDFIDFLTRSHCRYEGRLPIICCPDVVVGPPVTSAPVTRVPVTAAPVVKPPVTAAPISVPTVISPALPRSCGLAKSDSTRIIGGRPAQKGAWPWIAALGYRGFLGRLDFLCGGTLITNQHVLTAAHCVHKRLDLSVVRLGAHDLKTDPSTSYEELQISKAIPHENYNPVSFENDIALLQLGKSVSFKAGLSPACLPSSDFLRNGQQAPGQGFVAGWGATNFNGPASSVLMEALVPIKDNSECKQSYSNFRSIVIDDRTLCAGSEDKDTCQGDSGGPLMIFDPIKKNFNVAGVVSVGYKCAEAGFPGIYTRTATFMDWINKNIQ